MRRVPAQGGCVKTTLPRPEDLGCFVGPFPGHCRLNPFNPFLIVLVLVLVLEMVFPPNVMNEQGVSFWRHFRLCR
jgi:hypothetical protein